MAYGEMCVWEEKGQEEFWNRDHTLFAITTTAIEDK